MAPISRFQRVDSTCSTRRKEPSAPPEQKKLTSYVIIIMRLAVLVDVIAITARIAIILVAADHCADNAAGDRADRCAGSSADARKNRTRKSAGACAERRSGRRAGNGVVILWCSCTAA